MLARALHTAHSASPLVRRRLALLALAASCTAGGLLATAAPALSATPYTAYVANWSAGSLSPIDTATNIAGPAIAVKDPPDLAITPDGTTAWVANNTEGTVTPLTLATNAVGSPIAVGANPYAIAITPDGTKAYVANKGSNTVTPINLITRTAGSPIAVGVLPWSVAITPDGSKAYVASAGAGTVTPITIATNTPGTPITVGSWPQWVAMAPDGMTAYVANFSSNTITPIDLATNTPGSTIAVAEPNAIAITPDGGSAFVTDYASHTVTPVDLSTKKAGTPIGVGGIPYGIAIAPDGSTVYTAINSTNSVVPIDVATKTPGTAIPAGVGPDWVAITPDQAPLASFTATPGPAGAPTAFDASASTVRYGTITSYAWNFGDGSSATTSTPTTTHAYAAAGAYTATLTETDSAGTSTAQVFTGQTVSLNGGLIARAIRTVQVALAPQGSPTGRPASGDPPTARAMRVVISRRAVTITARGDALITVSCPASARAGCRGTITIRRVAGGARSARAHAARCARGCRTLGSASYEARAGQKKRIRVHIASVARRALARGKSVRVTVTVSNVSGAPAATTVLALTLKRRSHTA